MCQTLCESRNLEFCYYDSNTGYCGHAMKSATSSQIIYTGNFNENVLECQLNLPDDFSAVQLIPTHLKTNNAKQDSLHCTLSVIFPGIAIGLDTGSVAHTTVRSSRENAWEFTGIQAGQKFAFLGRGIYSMKVTAENRLTNRI